MKSFEVPLRAMSRLSDCDAFELKSITLSQRSAVDPKFAWKSIVTPEVLNGVVDIDELVLTYGPVLLAPPVNVQAPVVRSNPGATALLPL